MIAKPGRAAGGDGRERSHHRYHHARRRADDGLVRRDGHASGAQPVVMYHDDGALFSIAEMLGENWLKEVFDIDLGE